MKLQIEANPFVSHRLIEEVVDFAINRSMFFFLFFFLYKGRSFESVIVVVAGAQFVYTLGGVILRRRIEGFVIVVIRCSLVIDTSSTRDKRRTTKNKHFETQVL